jgi:hypothetical protein
MTEPNSGKRIAVIGLGNMGSVLATCGLSSEATQSPRSSCGGCYTRRAFGSGRTSGSTSPVVVSDRMLCSRALGWPSSWTLVSGIRAQCMAASRPQMSGIGRRSCAGQSSVTVRPSPFSKPRTGWSSAFGSTKNWAQPRAAASSVIAAGEETNVAVGGQLTNPAPPAGERTGSR